MTQKIDISIPTNKGVRHYSFTKAGMLSLLTLCLCLLGSSAYGAYAIYQNIHKSHLVASLQERLVLAKEKTQELSTLYAQKTETTHHLEEVLDEKRTQLSYLTRRVHDVEKVLGLTDNQQDYWEEDLEDRVNEASLNSAVKKTMLRFIPNGLPLKYKRISSIYGARVHPVSGKRKAHYGIDLTCKMGEPIYAVADGVVETVRPSNRGYGNYLTVRHTFGFMTSFAHLESFTAKRGQFIKKGEQIATCGNTGISTGPHLHYEVLFLGQRIDPKHSMDWSIDNFASIFELENKINWESLLQQMDTVVRLQAQLIQPVSPEHSSGHTVAEHTEGNPSTSKHLDEMNHNESIILH
ncbi:M23 family metallopeptidase [Vibrio sp.]|nr:M23 family metallopeptidase [Vibrio sp.]